MTSRPAARRGPKPKPGTRDTLVQAGLGIAILPSTAVELK